MCVCYLCIFKKKGSQDPKITPIGPIPSPPSIWPGGLHPDAREDGGGIQLVEPGPENVGCSYVGYACIMSMYVYINSNYIVTPKKKIERSNPTEIVMNELLVYPFGNCYIIYFIYNIFPLI